MNPFQRRTRKRKENPLRALFARKRRRTEPLAPARHHIGLPGWPGLPTWLPALVRPLRYWKWASPIVVLTGLYLVFYHLPAFAVASVRIEGASPATIEQVRQIAALGGQNIFAIDIATAWNAIEAGTAVKVTDVQRKVPDEVVITIVERTPRAIWIVGANRFVVDVDGIVLGSATPQSTGVQVEQTGEPLPQLKPGDVVSRDAIYLAEQLTKRSPEAVGANPAKFEWQKDGGMLMRTDRGWNVRIGASDDLDYKLVVWRAILDRAGFEKFAAGHADVRFPTRPFVRSR